MGRDGYILGPRPPTFLCARGCESEMPRRGCAAPRSHELCVMRAVQGDTPAHSIPRAVLAGSYQFLNPITVRQAVPDDEAGWKAHKS